MVLLRKIQKISKQEGSVKIFFAVEERGSVRTEATFTVGEYGQGSRDEALELASAKHERLRQSHSIRNSVWNEQRRKA